MMAGETFPMRVKFTDRQFLQAADLRDEQRYYRELRWRHNRGLHSWGVVAGLQVDPPTDGRGPVTVRPGMALDGYGRELVVPYHLPSPLDLNRDTVYDVWLVYDESEAQRRTGGSGRCSGPDDAANRTEEKPRVLVTARTERQSPDPSRPDAVPVGDLDFGPDRPSPDPGGSPWPVFLAGVEFRNDQWLVTYDERRYAGLVADRIESQPVEDGPLAEDRTVILNGANRGWSSYHFAVITAPAGTEPTPEVTPPALAVRTLPPKQSTDKDKQTKTAAAAGPEYRVELRAARVAVAGDLTLRNGSALEFAPNPIRLEGNHADILTGSEFWRIYHHFDPPKNAGDTEYSDELRITMPEAPAGTNRVAIGCLAADGKFTPVLAVKADKSVEVYGNLVVNGTITGTVTEAPAGATAGVGGSGVSRREMEATVRAYLTQGGTTRVQEVLDAVTGVGTTAQVTDYLVAHSSTVGPESWWQNEKVVEALGIASSKATAGDGGTFRKFLAKLDTPPDNGTPKKMTEIGKWALSQATPADKAGDLAEGFPIEDGEPSAQLVKFAKIMLDDDKTRLKQLVKALIKALNPQGEKKFWTEVGKRLPAKSQDMKAFLQGVAAPADPTTHDVPIDQLAAELFNAPDNVGKQAVAKVFLNKLPKFKKTLTATNTKGAPVRVFLQHVWKKAELKTADDNLSAEAKAFRQLWEALKFLATKFDDNPFWETEGTT